MTDSYYEILGVDQDASDEEIQSAFREKVKETHPDHSDAEDAGDRLQRVREARDTLLNAESRRRYDRQRDREQSQDYQDDSTTTEQDPSGEQDWVEWMDDHTEDTTDDPEDDQRHQDRTRQDHRRESGRNRHQDRSDERSDGRTRTRVSRNPETQTREREETSSRNRTQYTDTSLLERILNGFRWMGDLHHRLRWWIQNHFYSLAAVQQLLVDTVTSPTVIRLGATVALVVAVTRGGHSLGLSPTTTPALGLAIVLGCLAVSYATYAVVAPLPFEESRTRGRFKPAGRAPIWPAVFMNILGITLVELTNLTGSITAGVGFLMVVGVYTGLLLIMFGLVFTILFLGLDWFFNKLIRPLHMVKYGLIAAIVIASVLLFTQYGNSLRLDNAATQLVTQVNTTPWLPSFSFGPVSLGLVGNFLIAVGVLLCLFGSLITMGRYLTVTPWSDRYEHGYRVRPAIWNFVVAAPFVVLAWMTLAEVSVVTVSGIELQQSALWVWIFFLPTVLAGAYIIRRRLEPRLRGIV